MDKPIAMTSFARFYDAPSVEKVRIVRDARDYAFNPRGYRERDYYRDFRNTLRTDHWKTNDINIFANALGPLVSKQSNISKAEHFLTLGESYIDFWTQQDAEFFKVPESSIEIAGLRIRVTPEVGMRINGQNFVLKLWLNSPKAKRQYRQAIQFMTTLDINKSWQTDWQPALWDVRRMEILSSVPVPKEFVSALEGQAAAFQQMWVSLGK